MMLDINLEKKTTTLVSKIITSLMQEMKIKESELARQTGLPQTTINRLLLSSTSDPRANTLKPIANYFGVTVGQLIGEEPLNPSRIEGSFGAYNREAWTHVPIISWEDTLAWVFRKDSYNIYSHKKWIATERPISRTSFAITSKPFMEPRFRKNSILITDPDAEYQDSKFVVVSLDNKSVTVRQLIFDHVECYLKNFDTTLPTIKLDKSKHRILGVIIESRIDEFIQN
jgi:transcriptional regulator with XRE-family HTH domain